MRYLIIICTLFFLIACSGNDKIPGDVLNPKKMTEVLTDVLTADAVVNEEKNHDSTVNVNSLSPAYYQQVFTLHKISREDFFRSYDYYLNHPGLLGAVLDSANAVIAKKIMPGSPVPDKKKEYEKSRVRPN